MGNLGHRLKADHERLEAIFEDLSNRVRSGDTATIDAGWTRFEEGLVAHMAYEERHLLSLFDDVEPAEAAWIRADHQRTRQLLAEMGVSIQLHMFREAQFTELLTALRRHACREERVFYRWASHAMPAMAQDWRPRED